jgi:hypothetical protein
VLARLGKASVDGERRRLVVTGADLMSQFDDFEASRLARVDEEVARHEAKPQGFTAVLGRTPNGGDEDGWCGQGFGVGEELEQGGRNRARGSSWGIYTMLGRVLSHEFDRAELASGEEKRSTASRWPPCVKKEMRTRSRDILTEGVCGLLLGVGLGRVDGLLLGCYALVGPGEFFPLLFFFCFQFWFL